MSFLTHKMQQSVRNNAYDTPLFFCQLGKAKCMGDPRPDFFHEFERGALHGEYDETTDHEKSDQRLRIIAACSKAGVDRTYVFRVQGHHYEADAVCESRVFNKHYVYWTLTPQGRRVVEETACVVRRILGWIQQGLPPDEAGRPRVKYINWSS